MKNKTRFILFQLVTMAVAVVLLNGCKKDDNNSPGNPTNGKTTAVFNPSKTYGTMTDQDGNVYKTIVIGTQTWMAENLRTTKYRDGSAIPEVTENTAWAGLSTGAYCNYKNTTNIDTIATYGRLYNWYTVSDSRNIAPTGWHVPTSAEWTTLITNLGGESVAGGKLKELSTPHWGSPNTGADNSTGFTALPGGARWSDGSFRKFGYESGWWSTSGGEVTAGNKRVICEDSKTHSYGSPKSSGYSVRCIKD